MGAWIFGVKIFCFWQDEGKERLRDLSILIYNLRTA